MSVQAAVDLTAGTDIVEAATLYSPIQRGRYSVAQVAAIDARVRHGQLPRWQRITTRAPKGWK